ncbi:MAG TPA: hypothetical protein VF701_00880 [Thermoanaerobaculia bacterium]
MKRSWFYTVMGVVALLAVCVGFGRTYAIPLARKTFEAPTVVHVHGAFAMAWVLLFITQPLLLRWRRLRWHRQIGMIGLPLAIGVMVTMIPAGFFQATRDAQAGAGPTGISGILGVLTSGALFVGLVTAGIVARRDREAHARWLLLATLVMLWPAWFRFRHYFPSVPRPDIWFAIALAYLWIPVAAIRDRIVRGSVHPVIAWGGSFVILEQSLEVIAFDSPWWRSAAHAIYRWLERSWIV